MKAFRKIILFMILTLMIMTMAIPVSAAKPSTNDCGMLGITTSGEDVQYYMAVCVAEEDGNYVYGGNRPIQQQVGLYISTTSTRDFNSCYDILEDTRYDQIQGVYRFRLGDTVQSGTEADVFPRMAAAKRGETVYFVSLDITSSDVYEIEKTTVSAVRKGKLTTKDKLEEDLDNGDFSVIFNDNGEVVGFCKSGEASACITDGKGGIDPILIAVAAAAAAAAVAVLLVVKRKKAAPAPLPVNTDYAWEDDGTVMNDDTRFEDDFVPASGNALALKCRGGYLNGRLYTIPSEGITIGRDPANSIRYPGDTPGVSRRHAKLFWQNGQLMLLDEGSSNGTYVNNTGRISHMRPVALKAGDVFYLGEKNNGFEIICK